MFNELIDAVKEYVYDTENAEKCYKVAVIYDNLGQTASAILFYHRAAENAENKELAYECLIKCAACYERQGNRTHTVSVLLKHAVCLLPKRPEAYFLLSRLYERKKEYIDAYTYSQLGLGVSDLESAPLRTDVEYPGKEGLIFEKAVSGWWWGKGLESRKLFFDLKDNYYDKMADIYKQSIDNNISFLGPRKWRSSFKKYDSTKYSRLNFNFEGAEKIEKNFSQCYQDLFVLTCLKGKTNGVYLEVGSGPPFSGNNTALLETQFGWKGIGVEFESNVAADYANNRKNPVICKDALTLDYEMLCNQLAVNGVIDYLQLDCDPPSATFDILSMIPFDKFKFGVITFEHDFYLDVTRNFRKRSRSLLKAMGYELIAGNVSPNEYAPFEDWWVHPDVVDKETIEKMRNADQDILLIEEYMFKKNG
jgi:hypothetical protein